MIFWSKFYFFLNLGVVLKWKNAKKIKEKNQILISNRYLQSWFSKFPKMRKLERQKNITIDISYFFKTVKTQLLVLHYAGNQNRSTPSHIGGNFFYFHFFAQGNQVFSVFAETTLVTLKNFFFNKKKLFWK